MMDVEEVIKNLDNVLKTKLNPIITSINLEKNDGIDLLTVESSAVLFQSLNDVTLNYNPFIIYGIGNEELTSNGRNYSSSLSIFVIVAISSMNVDNIPTRLLRYSRALKQLILDTFDALDPELMSTGPIEFKDSNSGSFSKGIGIEFSMTYPF